MSIIAPLQSLETVALWSKLVLAALCIIPLVRLFTVRTEARRHSELLILGVAVFANLVTGGYLSWILADANRSVALAGEWVRTGTIGDSRIASTSDTLMWQQFLLNMRPTLVLLFVVALVGYYANRHATHRIATKETWA